MKGDYTVNRQTLVRRSLLLTSIFLFGLLVFGQGLRLAAAVVDQPAAYGQYLPITYAESCTPRPFISPNDPEKDAALETGINDVRMNNGLPILKHSNKISQAALRHSNDMAYNGVTNHIGSDGSDPGDRLNDACYHWQAYGEVLAGGYRSSAEAIAAWMDSPDHKDIILSDVFTEFGGAYAYNKNTPYKHFYTVDFGLRDTASGVNVKDYYTCTYTSEDEVGVIWLNLYSIWPCEDLLSSLTEEELASPN